MRVRTNALAAAAALLLGLSPEALAGQLGWVELQQDGIADVDGLDAVLSVAVSPDGAHVYAAGTVDDAVAVFERDLATGALGFVEVQKDGVAGVDGLRSASSVAVSPDGAHVYATGSNDHGIAVFERDVATGALDFVEAQEDGVGGVDGLRGAASVALSPDGSHVYVAGSRDYAVAVFERDPASGALGFVEVQQDGVGGVDGIAGAQSVAVSPDGAHVYVAGEVDHALAAFRRDATAGSLEFVEAEFDDVGGVDGLRGAWSVAVSPDGGQVYVAGRFDDSLAVFERDPATGTLGFVEVHEEGVAGVEGLEEVLSVAVSPEGAHVYAAAREGDAVAVFERDRATGTLSFAEAHVDGVAGVDGLWGAQAVAVSPDDAHVYAGAVFDDAVAVFATAVLDTVEVQHDGLGGVDGLDGARSVATSPDGAHVYVAGASDDAVAAFERDPATGALGFVEVELDGVGDVDGLAGALSVAVSGDGAHVYVAGASDDAVAVFDRDQSSGALDFVELQRDGMPGVAGLDNPSALALSHDDANLYATAFLDGTVAVFNRNSATGRLVMVDLERDDVGGVEGLLGASGVAVSPDDAHVYAVSFLDSALTVFERSAVTGHLSFVEVHYDGVADVDGLAGASAVLVSPDGERVYAAGAFDDAVAVFEREPATGALAFVGAKVDGDGGVDGLGGASALALTEDGSYLLVTGGTDDEIAVFARQRDTGSLAFVQVERDGVAGVDGLDGASGVAVVAGGRHTYVASRDDDTVAVFAPEPSRWLLHAMGLAALGALGVDRRRAGKGTSSA